MTIGLDMMGGDYAPTEAIKAIQPYLNESSAGATIVCIGDENIIKPLLVEHGLSGSNIVTIHTTQVIGMHEHPTKALKEKQDSSIAEGFRQLAGNKIDAFISAGNTGAMLVGTHYSIKATPGVLRPTISTIIPKLNGDTGLLLDVGLNADCKPEYLNQFAILGSVYANRILDIASPKVGLLNMGEEEGKGNILMQATYNLLKENPQINFIGNIEGRDVFFDKADVIVCDGYTGNIILKMAESIYDIAIARNLQNDEYLNRFNYERVGGTPILGIAHPVIIGHGISNAKAFTNMLFMAEKMITSGLCNKISEQFIA